MISDSLNANVLSTEYPANIDRYETQIGSEPPDFDHHEILVQSELELDGKKVQAYLTDTKLCWCATYGSTKIRKQRRSTHVINVSNIILTCYEQRDKKNKIVNEIELFPSQYFSVHFAKKCKHHKWKYQCIHFHAADSEQCQAWVDGIQNLLMGFTRPKKLLVFINPVGGKKQGEKIYQEKVAPYFNIAKISQTIIITERVNHAKDYLLSEDVSSFDGVLSVGGDGMLSEIINGMLRYRDGSHKVVKSSKDKPLIIGIIPAGSTDTVAYCTSGTNCPITAALHIILGDQLPLDVCSVSESDKFLKYSVSLMGYGYFGDLAKESEALRWMGPKRYEVAGFKRFMVNRSYEGEISFVETQTEVESKSRCQSGCQRCSMFLEETDHSVEDQWTTVRGRFISVIGANISCRCARSSTGLSPHAHTGDGCIDLILIKKTTRAKYLHHLIKVSEKTTEHFDFNFIDVHRVKEFKFKALTSGNNADDESNVESISSTSRAGHHHDHHHETSVWNIDGEIVENPDIHIRVHRQLLTVFARGIEE
ncbi:ceramide kinase-like [Hydractinia symbiolongicarpus]|uniref:ceramide kinase-like n=1 Tax=Hydractinia symbiolongicarpus TaxID=13093 RepID=UPI00254D9B87|nr:ceramide kinase-like [Hydractinia symbiolongicarpus]